jgi:hypothetical protein
LPAIPASTTQSLWTTALNDFIHGSDNCLTAISTLGVLKNSTLYTQAQAQIHTGAQDLDQVISALAPS